MLTEDVTEALARLRNGDLDASLALSFEQLSAKAFIEDLASDHPFVFQKREIGRKTEIGLAREVVYQFVFRKAPDSLLHGALVYPRLRSCYLISAYGDDLSEITWTTRIDVKPLGAGNGLTLSLGSGFKLDKTVDGWNVASLIRRRTRLSEVLLEKHGWQFEVLPPFGSRRSLRAT